MMKVMEQFSKNEYCEIVLPYDENVRKHDWQRSCIANVFLQAPLLLTKSS